MKWIYNLTYLLLQRNYFKLMFFFVFFSRILQRTSVSTNIKERLDFSCALFGPDGGLVSNAPHIPVHLGAMQEAVQYQVRYNSIYKSRNVSSSNCLADTYSRWWHPCRRCAAVQSSICRWVSSPWSDSYHTSLLEVNQSTVTWCLLWLFITMFRLFSNQSAPVFFVASRGHHADIGGITPGSMPPHSRTLDEEGAVFKR